MMNILAIILIVLVSQLCLYVSDNVSLGQCYIYQEYAYAASFLNRNSSQSIQENETSLGRTIAECYLNPLCFKLEIP